MYLGVSTWKEEGWEAHCIVLQLGRTVDEGDACLSPTHTSKAGQESRLGASFVKNKLKSELKEESLQSLGPGHVI